MRIEIADLNDIPRMREAWNELVLKMEYPSFFMTWEWITMWMEFFGHDYKISIYLGYENDKLSVIFPLARKRMRLEDGFLKVNVATLCGALELFPDHLDLICDKGRTSCVEIFLAHVFDDLLKNTTDIIFLPFLNEQGLLSKWIKDKCPRKKTLTSSLEAPYVILENEANHTSTKNNRIKRYRKQLIDRKGVTVKKIVKRDDLDAVIDSLFDLHFARSQEKGIQSTFVSSRIASFHKNLAKCIKDSGWFRLYLLEHQDKIICALYGFLFNNSFYAYQSGFDPSWSKYSPGSVIIHIALEDLREEKVRDFDFLGGKSSYKQYWSETTRRMNNYLIYGNTWLSRAEYIFNKNRTVIIPYLKQVFSLLISLHNFFVRIITPSSRNHTS